MLPNYNILFLIFYFAPSPCGGVLFFKALGVTWRVVFSLVFSFLGFCPRDLSALRASLDRPFEFTCGVLRICSVCCAHAWFVLGVAGKQYAQATLGGKPPFRNGVIGALPLPFGWLPTAQCIDGIRRSAGIGLCRPLWRPLASAEEGADSLSACQPVSAGGGTRAKRAVSEVWAGTPVPVDYPCIDGRPLFQQLPRQPSQRSRPAPHAKKIPFRIS